MSWVILSEEMGTAVLSRFVDTIPECTVAVVGGQGEAAVRTIQYVGDTTLTGIERREVFVDAKYATTADLLTTAGEKEIAANVETVIEMQFADSLGCVYGEDFTIGDIVTVDAGIYGKYDLEVVSVEISYTAEKRDIIIVLGSEGTNIVRMIRDVSKNNPILRV
jgi:hypothetical protein